MSFNALFLLSSHLLIFLGMIGLFFTEEISSLYLLLSGSCFALGALGEARGGKGFLPGVVAVIVMAGVFTHTLFSIFVLKELPLQALAHFLLALQAVKLLAPKKGRDWAQLYLLSFFSVVAASALSVEIFFAALFACYLFVAPWVLVLFHLKGAAEAAGKDPDKETRLLGWPLLRLVGGINIILFFLTLFFFITFPRLGVGLLGDLWAGGSAVTGFSDRLALGEVAKIQQNGAAAMRVSLDQPRPQGGKELYWRGLALDLFDGRKWQKSKSDLIPLRRFGESYRVSGAVENAPPLIHQKIILEPTGSPALFALNKPVTISGRLGSLFLDPLGNLRTLHPFPFQISYEVLSRPQADGQEKPPTSNPLQLPVMDPRVVLLARGITEGINEESNKARALERYLRENYRYSLEELPVGKGDPLATFLFEVRQGNCEYFSSTLAVMLRSLGIPARVVNGYLGGEWNPYGEYYLIRQSNAHSWVEAYFADEGWVTLDPTPVIPRGPGRTLFRSLTHFADFLRLNWYRYVINYTLSDQYDLFTALRQPRQWLDPRFSGHPLSKLSKRFLPHKGLWMIGVMILAMLVIGWTLRKRMKRQKQAHTQTPSHLATDRYRYLLRLLARRGFEKKPGETPDEFSQRAIIWGNGLVKEFTALYQQARFSGHSDFADGLKKMDQILIQLGKDRPRLGAPI